MSLITLTEHYYLALAAILAPTVIAILAHLIAKIPKIGNNLAKALCIITSYATLLMLLRLAQIVMEKGPVVNSFLISSLSIGELALTIYVDELALIPTIFFALFASAAMTYSIKYLSPENKYRPVPDTFNKGFSFMLLFLGSLVGCCFSGNMIFFLVFWEITSICSFFLVGFWHEDPKCVAAAFKTFVMLHIGTFSLLVGAILMYSITGTWEIYKWSQNIIDHSMSFLILLLFFVGIMPKAVQFPLHTWLPDVTVTATPMTVYIHAGFLLALYALPRFFSQIFRFYIENMQTLHLPLSAFFGNINVWNFIMSLIGAITSVVAPLFALLENEGKRVLAYIHISAVGGTVMVFGLGTSLGIASGLLSMVCHVLFAAITFLALGGVIFRVGKTSMDSMGGLSSYMPITAVIGTLGALSMAGFPFLGYFTALWLGIHAALELNATAFVLLLLFSSVLKTAAIFRLINSVFFGKAVEYKRKITEIPLLMLFPMLLISACLIVFGSFPQLLLNSLVIPAIKSLHADSELVVFYGDIITRLGLWNTLAGVLAFTLSLSLIAIIVYVMLKRSALIKRTYVKREEALKPFLCGEDIHLLDGARARHFYYILTHVLKIGSICHALDIDRFYNKLAESFLNFCRRILYLDIHQNYFPAILSFTIGALIITVIAVLAV